MSELFAPTISTGRLELRRFDTIGLREYHRLCSARSEPATGIEAVTRYLPWSPHETLRETADVIERAAQQWENGDVATYVVRPRSDDVADRATERTGSEVLGGTALSLDWELRTGTLAVWLWKPHWGNGYGQECLSALTELAFEELNLDLVVAKHVAGNANSRQMLERYVEAHGGQCDGRIRHSRRIGDEVVDEYRYTVTRTQYREN